jgi:hypothetical protein
VTDDFIPSAFTPFSRRFTDEKARDLDDTKRLYKRVAELHAACRYKDPVAFGADIYISFCDQFSEPVTKPFSRVIDGLLRFETPIWHLPVPRFNHLSLKEAVDLRHFLRAKEYFHTHEEQVATLLQDCIGSVFGQLAEQLPEALDPSPFEIPLIYTLPDPKEWMDSIIRELWDQRYIDTGLFVEVSRRILLNLCAVSDIADPADPKKPFKLPTRQEGSLHEIVDATFRNTPLHAFFLWPVPLKFTHDVRFSHMHVLGGSGAGKTTLLQNLILSDLQSDEPPSLVIVDSQGDLINKISHLALFDPDTGPLRDRFYLISPKDTRNPPALNIFDVNRERLGKYDEADKEQVTAGVIQTFDYLFSGLLGADLTAKQGVFFRFVARLMLALPETLGRNATILDMIALMDDPVPYGAAIESLPPIQRNFFIRDFTSKTFVQTKEQIRYRLNAILENPTLARLFTAPRTKLDLFTVLNQGGIVLVDTAKDFLKGSSAHFGRIFISLVLQAILERAVIPENKRRPTFLIVDEAAAYFDSNMDDFLTEARKYKCGCVFAHQFLDQATSSLRASLAANTSIKFAGGASMSDARALAPDMRTTSDFILSQPRLHFAAHIRNITPNAVSIPVPVGVLEKQPKLSAAAYEKLLEKNRSQVSIPESERQSQPAQKSKPASGETASESPGQKPDQPKPGARQEPPLKPKKDPSAASEDW